MLIILNWRNLDSSRCWEILHVLAVSDPREDTMTSDPSLRLHFRAWEKRWEWVNVLRLT